MKKILFISHAAAVGGATRSIMFLAKHTPDSLLLVPNDGPILDLYRQNGIRFEIQRVPNLFYSTYQSVSLFGIARFLKDLPKLAALDKYIRAGYTTLHFNEIVFAPTIFLLRLVYGKKIRIVTHARVTMPVHRLGWSRALFLRMLRSSDVIIAIGKNELEAFRDFPCAVRITNPVEFGDYVPQFRKTETLHKQFDIPEDVVIAGSFAQLHKGKGQDFLVRCLRDHPVPNFRLILFGEGDMEQELKDYICANGLENSVILAGYTNNVLAAMEGCDFIIRAEDFGYLGRDIIEANALGVPILTSLAVGYEDGELFEDGYNGFSFGPGDQAGFSRALHEMLAGKSELLGRTVRDKRGFTFADEYAGFVRRYYLPD